MSLVPPFTLATATRKVKAAQMLWNLRDPARVAKAYTEDSIWRNRGDFIKGHGEIEAFLTKKWERERNYTLRKELFAHEDNRIAVQFWYEAKVEGKWFRTYGLEHWRFADDGRMDRRQMSGNDVPIEEEDRWFKDGIDPDSVHINNEHWTLDKPLL